jgi:DNA polymerase (family 10)
MNEKIVSILREMAALMDLKGVDFKPRAFEKAADAIEELGDDVKDIYKKGGIKALDEIPGVGQGIAERIEEFLKTGKVKEHRKLKKDFPVDLDELTAIEGVGPKTAFELYKELGIKNIKQLEKAAKEGKISEIEGFGARTEEKILHGIEFLRKSGGRFILGFAMPYIDDILEQLREVPGVKEVEVAGSVRRMQETVGDLDILVVSSKPSEVMDFFISMDEISSVKSKGRTKSAVKLKIDMDADLLVIDEDSFGAALQYFTGDKYHNIQLREVAMEKGYKLNEYGLFKGKKIVAGKTEKEIYEKLGFDLMPPELRTNSGELEAAKKGELPNLIDYDDLKGDLQIQTDWTDGSHSITEMAEAAEEEGLEYILITDHTKALAMTGGLDEKGLARQMMEIDKVNKKLGSGFKVLKGAEVNIMKDGSLDIDDETLAELDIVGASVHTIFGMSEKDMTERIKRAMDNPHVDIIFHPTGRIIQKREAYKLDIDQLIKHAKKTKTIMEINAYPNRLDLRDEHIRKGVDARIKFSISTDAHHASHFQYLRFGIAQARRGWVEKKDVVNTRSWRDLLKLVK